MIALVENNDSVTEAQETLFRLGNLLGKLVKTPDGKGILISVETPSNGLYIVPSGIKCVVWYSTQCAQNRKVSWAYRPEDVSAIE